MEMETKENGEIQEDWAAPASPIEVLQQLSKEAVRMAGEAWQVAYSTNTTPILEPAPKHRRARSDATSSLQRRNNSTSNFQKWMYQMQRAFGGRSREDSLYSFDPEILANQKRQWYQLNSKTSGPETYKEPTSLFEHFVIVGLRPEAKIDVAEHACVSRKQSKKETGNTEVSDVSRHQHQRPPVPTSEPQVLFMYPPREKLALRLKDLAAFCFPGGVKPRILERSPSLSELNEIVYGQEHLCRDDLSFIFSLKVAGNATLYGVCLQVHEVVQTPPDLCGAFSPLSQSLSGCARSLVSAPRCFCILTRVPFFELHYEMLNSIVAQERLNRITKFVTEMALADDFPSPSMSKNDVNEHVDSPSGESFSDWITSPGPADRAMTLPAAAAGIISDEENSNTSYRCESPGSATASDASDQCQMRDLDKDDSKNVPAFDDCASENSEYRSDASSCIFHMSQSLQRPQSFESLFSPARSKAVGEADETFSNHDENPSDETIMQWARENQNDLLQIVCGYHCLHLPERGSKIIFQPLEHLQSIEYQRPPASALGIDDKYLDHELKDSNEASQVKSKLANAEEAVSLSLWSTATLCRVLSLESVLTLVTAVLLEKQIIVMCPNLGVLSAVVSSLVPIIRPFEWQSLFLPILPAKMLDFLDAPVPFIVGVQKKLDDMKNKASNLVKVDILKNQVNCFDIPQIPRRKELITDLAPIYSKLSCEESIAQKQPVYKCNEVQAEAATQFLDVMRQYLESLCSDLRLHTITNVQSNEDKVALLLKDSFIDSFPVKDQSFVKLFVETQLFTVLSDCRLSCFEKE